MFRTPSHQRELPLQAKSTVSGMGSTYGSFRSVNRPVVASRDNVIHHLKRELTDLKTGYKGLAPITQRLSTIEHRYKLLNKDKNADAQKFQAKDTMYKKIISMNSEDASELQRRIERKQLDIRELRSSFNNLERSVNATENEINILDQRLRDEVESYERLVDEKNMLEGRSSINQKEVADLRAKLALYHTDLEEMAGMLTKQARNKRELNDRVDALDIELKNKRSILYNVEKELGNQQAQQMLKDKEISRKQQKCEILRGDVEILAADQVRIDDDIVKNEQVLKLLCEERSDYARKLDSLKKDKVNLQGAVYELNSQIDVERKTVNDQETHSLEIAAQKRNLMNMLGKLRAGARKTSKAITTISDTRVYVRAALDRSDKVHQLLENAAAEVAAALRVAME